MRRPGFTMAEIVVAMTIVGVSLVACFSVLRMCGAASHHSKKLTQAVVVAESVLNEKKLEQQVSFRKETGKSGDFDWVYEVRACDAEGVGAVKVTVTWIEQGQTKEYELVSLRQVQAVFEGN